MLKLKVKKEFLPTRCQVCHKKDCYDQRFDFCSRCSIFLTENISNIIENMSSKEVLHDWQIITLKDVQIIWLKISLNLLALITMLYLTPLFGQFINSIPANIFGLFAIGATEILFIVVMLLAIFSNQKYLK
jgi:hypothetical protein